MEKLERIKELSTLLKRKVLVLDGATGTALEEQKPTVEEFGGERYEGCNEALNLFAPYRIEQLHHSYIRAGADIIETNSFNGNVFVLSEYGLEKEIIEINRCAAEIAVRSVNKYASQRNVFVAGAMGPTNRAISVTGNVTFDELVNSYFLQAQGLLLGGVDYLLLETQQDTVNLKAAWIGVSKAKQLLKMLSIPVAISVTIEQNGTMLAGQTIDALYYTIYPYNPFYIGLNCATGPEKMTDHLRTLALISNHPIACVPNAGLPDENGKYQETPQQFQDVFQRFLTEGFLNCIGGCCGTTEHHIRVLRKLADEYEPKKVFYPVSKSVLTGAETLLIDQAVRPILVGERTNVIGSKRFKNLISENRYDEAAEIAKEQVEKGAHIIDLCTADPDRDELQDFLKVLEPILRKVRVPIMIDTTDPIVVENALKRIGGRPVINSINFEEGEKRLEQIAPLAKTYSAAIVFGLIDENKQMGMAVTLERKLEIAERAFRTLTEKWNFSPTDIVFDPLVFPCGTGDPNYKGSAKATIDAVRLLKQMYPDCLTLLGISNVSFGLPVLGREILNSVFLYENVQSGLDLAIVNTAGLQRYATIPKNEIELCLDVIYERSETAITNFVNYYRGKVKEKVQDDWSKLSNEEKIAKCILEGIKRGLLDYINEELERHHPLDIINGPLMNGMKEVGKLFAENKLIVAEVLESAAAMKYAVDYLQTFLEKGKEHHKRGKMVLATVKGDVHDIGKNLVDMIFSNNGYEVINLGIKVLPDTLIEAINTYKPDFIGLSGLLVRSAQQMVSTAKDFRNAGIDIPLLVGGAALTKKFTLTKIATEYKGPTFYAATAMEGLQIANRLMDPQERVILENEWREIQQKLLTVPEEDIQFQQMPVRQKWVETEIPQPPDLDPHVLTNIPLDEVVPLINPMMLYGKHLGLKNSSTRLNNPKDKQAWELQLQVEKVLRHSILLGVIQPRVVYQFFQAYSENETIHILSSNDMNQMVSITFPREKNEPFRCAADWIMPKKENHYDNLAIFVTNAGLQVPKYAKEWMDKGELLNSHILSAIAIEIAEATAEWIHKKIRHWWGYHDKEKMTFQDYLKCNYRGIRLSFGYPACPRLEDQQIIFQLLQPEKSIGVKLTEEYMMEPEASVSAIVFHHPNAEYFSV
ncbi:MAG: methionine synthase [bacterium]|nr:methionine synthase [bacterium]